MTFRNVRPGLVAFALTLPLAGAGCAVEDSSAASQAIVADANQQFCPCTPSTPAFCEVIADDDVYQPISDHQTITRTIEVPSAFGGLLLTLDLEHTASGNLTIFLTGPAGQEWLLWNRDGRDADFRSQTFEIDDSFGTERAGTWTLTVRDDAGGDTGTFEYWAIRVIPACPR